MIGFMLLCLGAGCLFGAGMVGIETRKENRELQTWIKDLELDIEPISDKILASTDRLLLPESAE